MIPSWRDVRVDPLKVAKYVKYLTYTGLTVFTGWIVGAMMVQVGVLWSIGMLLLIVVLFEGARSIDKRGKRGAAGPREEENK